MAMSTSVKEAQDLKCCQICRAETQIDLKCLTCKLMMCDTCYKENHPRFENAKDHEIIVISEQVNIDFTNIKCKEHPGEACCNFCCTCDMPVCPTCIAKTHSQHEFLEIKEVYPMKTERIKKSQKKIENDEAMVTKISQDLADSYAIQDSAFNKASNEIQDQREALMKKVDQHIEKLKKEVEQTRKTAYDSFSKEKNKIDKVIQTLQEQKKKAEDIVKSKDASKFFSKVDDLVKSMEKALPSRNITKKLTIMFVPGDINLFNFGSIQTDPSLEVIREFTTYLKSIDRLLSQEEGSLWICNFVNYIFLKGTPDKGLLKTILRNNIPVFDMSITPSNDLLLSTMDSTLKWINIHTEELTDSLYSVEPLSLITTAVHVTLDNKIIAGAITPGPSFPVTRTGMVVMMEKNGEHRKVYGNDNTQLFNYPLSITSIWNENRNGNVAVIDRLSEDRTGRLVILRNKGINFYNGNPEINNLNPFKPGRVVTTPLNNLLVTDTVNSVLHILDCDGQFIQYIDTMEKGIPYPLSLAYTATGLLYIGCTTYALLTNSGNSEKTKLYEVELSGC